MSWRGSLSETPLLYVAQVHLEDEAPRLVGVGRSVAGTVRLLKAALRDLDARETGYVGPAVDGAWTEEVVDRDSGDALLGYSLTWPVRAALLEPALRDVLLADQPMLPSPGVVELMERAVERLRRQPLGETDRMAALNLLGRGLELARQEAVREARWRAEQVGAGQGGSLEVVV